MAVANKRRIVRLRDSGCDWFTVMISVAQGDFLSDAFRRAIPPEVRKANLGESLALGALCNRRTRLIDYRAVFEMHPATKGERIHFHIDLRPTTRVARGEKGPFAEEIFSWLYRFLKKGSRVALTERAGFRFPSPRYHSAFSLPLILSGSLNPTGNPLFDQGRMNSVGIELRDSRDGFRLVSQFVSEKALAVTVDRHIQTPAEKLLSVERDIEALGVVASSTVKSARKKK